MRLRETTGRDVPVVLALVNDYARQNLVLARTEESLRECLADFAVAEVDGDVVGCGALSELGPGLGEIRSLAVRADMSGRGIGRAIIEYHMGKAWRRGFVEVLALTRRVSLFEKLGFHITRRERFLDKLAADCQACPLSLCCDETAVHWMPPEALAAAREVTGEAGGFRFRERRPIIALGMRERKIPRATSSQRSRNEGTGEQKIPRATSDQRSRNERTEDPESDVQSTLSE